MDKIPEIIVEKYRRGELSDPKLRERIEALPDMDSRIADLARSDAEVLAEYPPQAFVTRIRNRAEACGSENAGSIEREGRRVPERAPGGGMFRRLSLLAPMAAILVAALGTVLLVASGDSGTTSAPISVAGDSEVGTTRTKGLAPSLRIYRYTPEGAERLQDGEEVRPGDRLQLSYIAAESLLGVIFSIDGRGVLTLHYPPNILSTAELSQDGEVLLPYAYALDDAPDFETFYFAHWDGEIEPREVVERAREQAARIAETPGHELDLPSDVQVTKVRLRKR